MDALTTSIIANIVCSLIIAGYKVTSEHLKSKLKGWLISDYEINLIASRVNEIEGIEDLNQKAIAKRLDKDDVIQEIIQNIKQDPSFKQVNQSHYGQGDNVAGDKVITQNNYK